MFYYQHITYLVQADPHGGDLIGNEMWLIDQSPTGLIIYCDKKATAFYQLQKYLNNFRVITFQFRVMMVVWDNFVTHSIS